MPGRKSRRHGAVVIQCRAAINRVVEQPLKYGPNGGHDCRSIDGVEVHFSVGVVGARAGEVLGRVKSATHAIEAKLAGAEAADQCAVVGKGCALKKEKMVVHIERAAADHGHVAVRCHVAALK